MGVSTAIYRPKGAALEYAPLACNLWEGCTHGCRYCYVPGCLRRDRAEFHAQTRPREGILEALERDAAKLVEQGRTDERVLLCFTSDPYQPAEAEHRLTRSALGILNWHKLPWTVLTKGGLRAAEDFGLYAQGDGWFGTSLVWTDFCDRQYWEPQAATAAERLYAIQEARRQGIRTWVSLEPVVEPGQAFRVVEQAQGYVDEWRVGKLNHHPAAAEVDWRAFARGIHRRLHDLPCDYVIKSSLAPYADPDLPLTRQRVAQARQEMLGI